MNYDWTTGQKRLNNNKQARQQQKEDGRTYESDQGAGTTAR